MGARGRRRTDGGRGGVLPRVHARAAAARLADLPPARLPSADSLVSGRRAPPKEAATIAAGDSLPIAAYAVIGDCRSAALVGANGSIDWLCWPRFDSPSIFGALLDTGRGGHFAIHPDAGYETERAYASLSNVLVTTFRTTSGECRLRDAMPVSSEEEKARTLRADHEVLREVEGVRGEVELRVDYAPRPRYGQTPTPRTDSGRYGIRMDLGGTVLLLRTDAPVEWSCDEAGLHSALLVRQGERHYFSLSYAEDAPAVLPLLGEHARKRLDGSVAWWREWAGQCRYTGPHRDAVVRSALAVKLLTYAPSGAIVAAATTSLPEWPGSTHNYDYRYCWLRDAALTASALIELGYRGEAEAFLGWMLHATRLTQPELQIVYSVTGEARLPERELAHWAGYAGSLPIRTGNEAYQQLQLDVYGEVVAAAAVVHRPGATFDGDTRRLLRGIGDTVLKRWREPDEGIWEPRGTRQHHTHSKVLCWVALDRLIRFHEEGALKIDVERYRAELTAIRAEVEARGYNESLQSYVSVFDGDGLDASLLVLPLYGYIAPGDRRMTSTVQRIRTQLGTDSLVRRYQTPDDDRRGAFGICSFWAAECLARAGNLDAASTAFEELLLCANDVGLYAEQIDPVSGAALGNFPQAFTHIGLINAALSIYGGGSNIMRPDIDA